jgi:hypothetical protein
MIESVLAVKQRNLGPTYTRIKATTPLPESIIPLPSSESLKLTASAYCGVVRRYRLRKEALISSAFTLSIPEYSTYPVAIAQEVLLLDVGCGRYRLPGIQIFLPGFRTDNAVRQYQITRYAHLVRLWLHIQRGACKFDANPNDRVRKDTLVISRTCHPKRDA